MLTEGEASMFSALETLAADTGHAACAGMVLRRNDKPLGEPITISYPDGTLFGFRVTRQATFNGPSQRVAYLMCVCGLPYITAN